MDYMYGQLYKQIKEIEYKGRNSETTVVTVDQKTKTIRVDVKILSPEQLPKDEGNYVLLVEIDENGNHTLKWVSTQSTLDRIKELEDKTYKLTYNKDADTSTFDSNITINKDLNVEGNTIFNNKVTVLNPPVDATDATNREYVDDSIKAHFTSLNIENSTGNSSLRQKYSVNDVDYGAVASGENAVAFGGKRYDMLDDITRTATSAEGNQSFAAGASVHAYGDFSAALGKDTKAYQKGSFAVGGGTQSGMTEAEFNDYYWDSTNNIPLHNGKGKDADGNILDTTRYKYSESYSASATFGEDNKSIGRALFTMGQSNKNIGSCNSVGGKNNTVDGIIDAVYCENTNVAGSNDKVFADNSDIKANDVFAAGTALIGNYGNQILLGSLNNNARQNLLELGCGQPILRNITFKADFTNSDEIIIKPYYPSKPCTICIVLMRLDNTLIGNAKHYIALNGNQYFSTKTIAQDDYIVVNNVYTSNPLVIKPKTKGSTIRIECFALQNKSTSGNYQNFGISVRHNNTDTYKADILNSYVNSQKNAFEVLWDGRAKVHTAPKENDDVVRFEEINDVYVRRYKAAVINERRAYVVLPDGYDYTLPIHTTALGDDLPIRTSTGQLKAADGVADDDLATIKQLNEGLNVKLDKVAITSGKFQAYIAGYDENGSKQLMVDLASDTSGNSIARRDNNGRLQAAAGAVADDVATFGQLEDRTNALQANIDKKIDLVEGDTTIALKNNSTISYTSSTTASTIMQRDSSGRVKVEDGINNKDAVNKGQLDTKLDLTGGTLTGNLTIQDADVEITKTTEGKGNLTVGGNLKVNGTTTTVDTETLAVKDNLIVTNSSNTELLNLSGLAIKTGNKDAEENAIAYGILYDPATSADSVKLGLGSINKTTNEFTFKTAADANPVATRDDSTKLTDNHLLVWNSAKHTLIDANNLVDSITPASLGLNNFVLDGGEIVQQNI